MDDDSRSFDLFGWLMVLLFWILIIVGVVVVVRWIMDQGKPNWLRTEETALDILKKRYASGEIDKEQFETMRQELM